MKLRINNTIMKLLIHTMNRVFVIIGLLIIVSKPAFGKHIDENTARQVGLSFLCTRTTGQEFSQKTILNLVYVAKSKTNSSITPIQPIIYFYVFNAGTSGFVMVSGDDIVSPILGYSTSGAFDPDNIPNNAAKWFEGYKSQIRFAIENKLNPTIEISNEWKNLIYADYSNNDASVSRGNVNPLIQTKWNQSPYYNALCPGGSVTGCVATAMAQIMKYWNYPSTGSGFHSYNHQTYGTLSANFGGTAYQWSSMPNTVSSSNNAVGTLMYQCGVSVDMNYSPTSSGAYVISSASPIQDCAEYALKTYFGYKNTLQGIKRSNYSQTQWLNLIKTELDVNRPIIYAGFGSGGGHCFVADGYDNNDYIHFNWGWGGFYDGYFQINALNPGGTGTGGGTGGYNTGHQAVIGIQPPGSGASPTFNLQLYSNINMTSTQIWFTNPFSLTVDIANYGTGSFSGQYGAAVFDNNLNFVDFMEIKSGMTLNPNSHYTNPLTFSNTGSTAFVPGTYYVAMFYKTTTQNWTIIGNGSYTNLKQFKINYSSAIETNSNFTITTNGGRLIQGSSATINVDLLNTGSSTFYGQFRINLANLDRSWAQDIQILNENNGLPYNFHYSNGNNFSGNITVAPGTYLLEVAYKAQGSSTWYYAGSSNYSNPIYVIVEAPTLSPDRYENNNTLVQSYTLPINFSGNSATLQTSGSNFHIGTDYDFYKINLPPGYNYTITPRLHDSYNSGNGVTYSGDGLFSYSSDGTNWSDSYDDVMPGNITIQNGGNIYFHVAPYFAGEIGTYLLDIGITRSQIVTGVTDIELSNLITLYPNPASDYFIIDTKNTNIKISQISILNILGQDVKTILNPTNNQGPIQVTIPELPSGTFIVQLNSNKGLIAKKIVIKK